MDENDSLDPVAPWEILGRLCDPDQWDGNFLRPDAITIQDLQNLDRGWSVQRIECTKPEVVARLAAQLSQDPARATVARALTSQVRAILTDAGAQAFFVLENYLPCNPAHALVYTRDDIKKGLARKMRERLIEVLTKHGFDDLFH